MIKTKKVKILKSVFFQIALVSGTLGAFGQSNIDDTYDLYRDPTTSLWLGSYMNFRLTDKLFWAGELHYRRTEHNSVPYVGKMAQIYNRHGIKYMFSKNFNATAGGVLRIDFTPDPGNENLKKVILEPRLWHEYVFGQPLWRGMVYHRLRLEHRWSKNFDFGANYNFRNRYRYKFLMKIPLNTPTLTNKTFYFAPDVEIIMQSGKTVPFSLMEDLRLYPHFGYVFSPRIGGSTGMMYTLGQSFERGNLDYRQRWIFRVNTYISLDWRKFEDKLLPINIAD